MVFALKLTPSRWVALLLILLWSCLDMTHVRAGERPVVIDRPAIKVNEPQSGYLLSVTRAGDRLVAVGENGRVVLSDDGAKTWRQAKKVPTSVLLTQVRFANPQVGWAVGHLGVVLHTVDGGESWQLKLDGVKAAQQKLVDAKSAPEDFSQDSIRQAELLVGDGPDKPFLTLIVESSERVRVFGAFGLAFGSENGGETWASLKTEGANPQSLHFYGSVRSSNGSYVVGEQGLLIHDDGQGSFTDVQQPYEGTLFGAISLGETLVAYGLRGNVVSSRDAGRTWQVVDSGLPATIQAGVVSNEGLFVLAAENGQLSISKDGGEHFSVLHQHIYPAAELVSLDDSHLLLVGPRGVQTVNLAQEVAFNER